ncbi:hypothetical protein SAMN05444422_107129 [Halobiforma haloterrestris]|uniref:Uncharacterized protein n=1 Tax=Natronobacterium haloterrestre TaxID=148448 RepID=A0A1I1ILX9_NATHA|nr:helix-turn-helix domain-containing protein [Halobiforma haloterrestris]SFC34793.1 hypothetical protein SAMN05444422_107129 [Halobiforma haloterrestris]
MTVESARSAARRSDTDADSGARPLCAMLEVTPGETTCPVASAAPNATAVKRSISADNVCHSAVTVESESEGEAERRYVSERIEGGCFCATLSRFDCVFDVEGVSDGSLLVSVIVEDRETIGRIVDALERDATAVRLRRLTRLPNEAETSLEVDTTKITEKQREAVELAVELGYYGRPREATLEDLADELGISKSAVSQRLNAVETTLVRSFTDS